MKGAAVIVTAVGLLAILAGFVVVSFVTSVVYGTIAVLEALNP